MYTQTFNIGAYLPAVTDDQSSNVDKQLAVVDGENFAWKASGVFSAFGHEIIAGAFEGPGHHVTTFQVGGETWVFGRTQVAREAGGVWETLYEFPAAASQISVWDLTTYKWTHAYVGTRHWFAHPQVGLVYFDQFDGEWGTFRHPNWLGPVYACCHADNRLVVMLNDVVAWSRFDRGHEFDDVSWHCGTGAQSLALIRYGQPFGVYAYNGGWLSFTSAGIMLSMPSNQQNTHPNAEKGVFAALVFNHEEVSWQNLPVGSLAIAGIDDKQVIWVSNVGLLVASPGQGGSTIAVTPVDQPMNSFYVENILRGLEAENIQEFRLDYLPDADWLVLSSRGGVSSYYTRAHILQRVYNRWASFNFPHECLAHIGQADPANLDSHKIGFITPTRRLAKITHRPHAYSWIRLNTTRLEAPNEQIPAGSLVQTHQIRVGRGKPAWDQLSGFQKRSSWLRDKREAWAANRFDLYIAGSWDSQTEIVDERVKAMPVKVGESIDYYAVDTTGVVHTIYVECAGPDDFYEINSVEVTFTFAGVL